MAAKAIREYHGKRILSRNLPEYAKQACGYEFYMESRALQVSTEGGVGQLCARCGSPGVAVIVFQ